MLRMVKKTNPAPETITQMKAIHTAFKIISSETIDNPAFKCQCDQQFRTRKTYLNHKKVIA